MASINRAIKKLSMKIFVMLCRGEGHNNLKEPQLTYTYRSPRFSGLPVYYSGLFVNYLDYNWKKLNNIFISVNISAENSTIQSIRTLFILPPASCLV